MKVIVDFCLIPIGAGTSLGKYIAECQRVLESSGLKHEMHAYGTNIEGEWADVFSAIEECHQRLHTDGVPRINTTLKIGTRVDREQLMEDKVASVHRHLEGAGV